jgi:dolichyl-diphosphooligosaccharide--protein glycosyltransferase
MVSGARVTGQISDSGTIPVKGDCKVGHESRSIGVEHSVGDHGIYDLTLPLPGTYSIGDTEISVTEAEIIDGVLRSEFDGEGDAYWSFDEGQGDMAYDYAGGRHATIKNGTWVDGVESGAISFEGEGFAEADPFDGSTNEFTVSAWIMPARIRSGAILSIGKDGWNNSTTGLLFDHGYSGTSDDRLGLWLGNGNTGFKFHSPFLGLTYPTETFHQVAAVFDHGTVRWYLNGELLRQQTSDRTEIAYNGDRSTYIGREHGSPGGMNYFHGGIDEIRYVERVLSDQDIRKRARQRE